MKTPLFLLLATSFLLCECTTNAPIEDFQVESIFEDYYSATLVNNTIASAPLGICSIVKKDWDSILVIKPYTSPDIIKSINIFNYSAVGEKVENQYLNETTCTLLFVNGKQYVGYSVLPRNFVDLTTLVKNTKNQYLWINKDECNSINIVKVNDEKKYKLIFVI
jgi:hypothetical protein